MKRIAVLMLLVIFAMSCSDTGRNTEALRSSNKSKIYGNDEALEYDSELEIEPPRTAQPPELLQKPNAVEKKQSKIIKDGVITLEVDSLEIAKQSIDSIVRATNAYFENEIYNGGVNQHRYTLKIRIPNSEFETFISSLESGGGKMVSKSINARDVTGEYIDLEIRLKNNQAYLVQYRALLNRAKSIKDILEIEEKARRIESEIDSQLGRMKYINDQVRYSTLTLNLYQKRIYRNEYKAPTFLSRVWNSSIYGFVMVQEVLLWGIALWPFMVLLGLAYVGRRLYMGRRKKEIH